MHAKTDSEGTSLDPSSPTRSSRRPVYFVQSPSRDSHDGVRTTTNNSFYSTPVISPLGSPPHSNSSIDNSRESSSSRFSGSLKHHHGSSRKISPNDGDGKTGGGRRGRKNEKKHGHLPPWKDCEVIEEEGLLDDDDERRGLPRRCYYLAFLLGFFVLFSFFSLVLWGASKNQKPKITMKSIKFENFIIQAGTDSTGVPTDMVSLNSTVKFTFRNTATFFGLHVTSTPLGISYSDQLTLASGNMRYFYQGRKSQRNVVVVVEGNRIPLYGGGSTLSTTTAGDGGGGGNSKQPPVLLTLGFKVRSRAYVLGKLVKPKFYIDVVCHVMLFPNKLGSPLNLNNCKVSSSEQKK